MKRFYVAITLLLLGSLTVLAQTRKSLVPSAEERLKYAESLKTPGTRLIRLLPREKYDVQASRESPNASGASFPRQTAGDNSSLHDVPYFDSYPRALKVNSPARGGGAYYSFTRRNHEYGNSSHLSLEGGRFLVGFAGANYGFLINLGDIPLDSVALDTTAVALLARYKRAAYDGDARRESRRISDGGQIGGLTVNSGLPMRPDSTYLVRAINYGDSDVLVAFRVVEIESDGSALIVWKMLKRYSTPQVQR